eukprot:g6745.t1
MLDLGDDALGVYPIWLCPYLNKHHEPRSIHHPHSDKDEMYIDVGYYGLPSVPGFDMKSALRRIEEWLLPRKGFVMLYALHTLTEKDLRRMFSLEAYDRVRSRMGSATIFPTIDEKDWRALGRLESIRRGLAELKRAQGQETELPRSEWAERAERAERAQRLFAVLARRRWRSPRALRPRGSMDRSGPELDVAPLSSIARHDQPSTRTRWTQGTRRPKPRPGRRLRGRRDMGAVRESLTTLLGRQKDGQLAPWVAARGRVRPEGAPKMAESKESLWQAIELKVFLRRAGSDDLLGLLRAFIMQLKGARPLALKRLVELLRRERRARSGPVRATAQVQPSRDLVDWQSWERNDVKEPLQKDSLERPPRRPEAEVRAEGELQQPQGAEVFLTPQVPSECATQAQPSAPPTVNFAVVAKPFLHITWFSILGQIIRAAYQLNSLHYMWVATCTLTYAVLWEAEHRPFTPDRSRYVCIFLHFAVIFGNMACFAEDWDKMICTHAAHVLFHLNLATIMSDLWSSIPLSLCFCASTVLCYISVYGWASISNEFMMTLGEQHGALEEFVGLPLCDWMEAESQQPFVDFIAASSAEGHDASAPRCLRVAFKAGEGASVPGGKHHLLALAEDARPLPDAEVEDCPASQRSGLERPARDEAGDLAASLTSVSADCIQAFKELVELNLFLDPYQHGREDDSLLDDAWRRAR